MTDPNPFRFPETRWTLLGVARHDEGARSEVIKLYYEPVRRFFKSIARGSQALTDDWTQDFFLKQWEYKDDGADRGAAARGVINRADRQRGTFRGYLLTTLKRFALTRLTGPDKVLGGGASGSRADESDPWDRLGIEQASVQDALIMAARAFSEEWVLARLAEAASRAQARCLEKRRAQHFILFREHYLPEPGVDSSWEAIALRHSTVDDPLNGKTARNRAATPERYFRRALLELVRGDLDLLQRDVPHQDPSNELHELLGLLGERHDR